MKDVKKNSSRPEKGLFDEDEMSDDERAYNKALV